MINDDCFLPEIWNETQLPIIHKSIHHFPEGPGRTVRKKKDRRTGKEEMQVLLGTANVHVNTENPKEAMIILNRNFFKVAG